MNTEGWVKTALLHEGKAKKVWATNASDYVIVDYKDDATAFNGVKKGSITDKGIVNNIMSNLMFGMLESKGIPTHFVKQLTDRETVCRKAKIIPLEVIVRNISTGSMVRRLKIDEGIVFDMPIQELCWKDDDRGDPLLNDDHALALKLATRDELDKIHGLSAKINSIMQKFFLERGITLVDFKLEFGKTFDNELILADEISPDTCRFWDMETGKKLDKDRFRQDLGDVEGAYAEMLKRVENG